jgi:2,3-bisphosphoglycerate-independent phosphoglycerate mutase
MYIDTNRTRTEAEMLMESRISSTKEGTGTSMTKTVATAAAGTIQSVGDFSERGAFLAGDAIIIVSLLKGAERVKGKE